MYFPVLRGKKYELQAVEELVAVIKKKKNICPVIEPMNVNSLTKRILFDLDSKESPFILAINPCVGDMVGCTEKIEDSLINEFSSFKSTMLAYLVDEETTLDEVKEVLEEFENFNFAIFHVNDTDIEDDLVALSKKEHRIKYHLFNKTETNKLYRKAFKDFNRVIIEDPYRPAKRNADYPKQNAFSDTVFKYHKNYYGFGDFQTIGGDYSENGGPAHAVALHLTDEDIDEEELNVVHFVSTDVKGNHNVQGKYFQALKKLCDYVEESRGEPFTVGEIGFAENLIEGKFHGLGFPKKLSIMHHVHLMSELMK